MRRSMLANRSRYALGATIYTTDLDESMRAVNELEAGMVWVNAPLLDNDAGPFGGRKQSGMGRQLGAEGSGYVPAHQAVDDRSRRQAARFLVVSLRRCGGVSRQPP